MKLHTTQSDVYVGCCVVLRDGDDRFTVSLACVVYTASTDMRTVVGPTTSRAYQQQQQTFQHRYKATCFFRAPSAFRLDSIVNPK